MPGRREYCSQCGARMGDLTGPGLCIHCSTAKVAAQDPPADETETRPVTEPCDMAPALDPDPAAAPEPAPAPAPESAPTAAPDPAADVFNYQLD